MVITISGDAFEKEVLKSDLPVVVDFHASWCGPCLQMVQIFDEVSDVFADRCKFIKVNVDDARDVAIHFGITSIPTFLFVKGGDVKRRETGYMGRSDFEGRIESFLKL